MKRNWEIVRELLLRLEHAQTHTAKIHARDLSTFRENDVAHNMWLLKEAGYIDASIHVSSANGEIDLATASRLTHKGHDLLDTIRRENAWSKIKETFREKGVEMTFDLVMSTGKTLAEKLFEG